MRGRGGVCTAAPTWSLEGGPLCLNIQTEHEALSHYQCNEASYRAGKPLPPKKTPQKTVANFTSFLHTSSHMTPARNCVEL